MRFHISQAQGTSTEFEIAYRTVVESGDYILGEKVTAFKREFAEYCRVRHCIGIDNGLEAIHLIQRFNNVANSFASAVFCLDVFQGYDNLYTDKHDISRSALNIPIVK
jgi:dTDP-4-amino-4,6-dideoxygalactose transaminase